MTNRTFKLNKLVRDGIVEGHQAIGGSAEFETLEGRARIEEALDKMQEELDEARANFDSNREIGVGELADIRQLTEDINAEEGRTLTDLHAYQYDKRRKVGGFAKWLFVRTASVPENSDLARYYFADPKRFKEEKK